MKLIYFLALFLSLSLAQQNCFSEDTLRESQFVNRFFPNPPFFVTQNVPIRNFGTGPIPGSTLTQTDYFAIRWDGQLVPTETGTHRFIIGSDDGFRLYINGVLRCQLWGVRSFAYTFCNQIQLTAGVPVDFVLEYFEFEGQARIETRWTTPTQTNVLIPNTVYQLDLCQVRAPQIDTFTDFDAQTKVGDLCVSLTERPLSEVQVDLESDCAIFENCTLTFNTNDWEVCKPVRMATDPANEKACCVVRVKAVAGDPDFVGNEDSFSSCTEVSARSLGYSYGDPHIVTYDGVLHDFFDSGDFYLTRSFDGSFAVQARQTPCAAASCNTGVAVKFLNTLFYVYMDVNGNPTPAVLGNPADDGVTIEDLGVNGYRFRTNTGILVSIRVGLWASRGIYYLGISVQLPGTYQGEVGGLLGFYDEDPANDYFKADGTVTAVLSEFQRSWAVSMAENLFVQQDPTVVGPILGGGNNPTQGGLPELIATFSTCPEPPVNPFNETTPPDNTTVPFENRTTECVTSNATLQAIALGSCDPPFNNTQAQCCIDLGVDPNKFYATCLCDVYFSEGTEFTSDNVNAFYAACDDAAKKNGTSCETCPSNCFNRGSCVNATCICDEGYSGEDCGTDDTTPPKPESTVFSVAAGCPISPITVDGEFFYPNTELWCDFSGSQTMATRISSFKLTCPVPTFPTDWESVELSIIRNGTRSANNVTIELFVSCCTNPCPTFSTCIGADDEPATCQCDEGYQGPNCDPSNCIPSITPNATLKVNQLSTDLEVTMQSPITANVTVVLTSDCVYLDKCELTFTPADWNMPQLVMASFNPGFRGDNCSVTVTGNSSSVVDCIGNSDTSIIYIERPPIRALGKAYGDPHFLTYDGNYFIDFSQNLITLTRDLSGEFVVQSVQLRVCSGAGCLRAVVAKFRSTVMTVSVDSNDAMVLAVSGNPAADQVSIVAGTDSYEMLTPTGIKVQVFLRFWADENVFYLDSFVHLPETYMNKMAGVLGNFDGNPNNDWVYPNGRPAATSFEFLNAWRPAPNQNLFRDSGAIFPPIGGASWPSNSSFVPCNSPIQEGSPATLPTGGGNDNNGELPPDTNPNPPPTCDPSANQTLENMVFATCDPLFNDTIAQCCKAYTNADPYYSSCLCDVRITKSSFLAYSSLNSFYSDCQTAAAAQGQSCDICPQGCNGNGACVNGACSCSSGYMGDACEENWNELPVPLALIDSTSGMGCSVTLTVTGRHFYGNSLSCNFGATTVPATRVSNTQLTCTIPSLPTGTTSVQVTITRSGQTSTASVELTFYESCCEDPCENGAACLSDFNSPTFTCSCPSGFGGTYCEIVADCDLTMIEGGSIGPAEDGNSADLICPVGTYYKGAAQCVGSSFVPTYVCETIASSCPAGVVGNAQFPETPTGVPGQGVCQAGYSGSPIRNCNQDGTWGSSVLNGCVRNTCPALNDDDNADWPMSNSLTNVQGTCNPGYLGSPSRACLEDGTWGAIMNPCVAAQSCPVSLDYAHADYPLTSENTMGFGVCNPGYTGTAQRFCKPGGVWSELVSVHCQRIVCPAFTDGNGVFYRPRYSGDFGFGTCPPSTNGDPRRLCRLDGTWGNQFGRACV